jgi:hypothetical protein
MFGLLFARQILEAKFIDKVKGQLHPCLAVCRSATSGACCYCTVLPDIQRGSNQHLWCFRLSRLEASAEHLKNILWLYSYSFGSRVSTRSQLLAYTFSRCTFGDVSERLTVPATMEASCAGVPRRAIAFCLPDVAEGEHVVRCQSMPQVLERLLPSLDTPVTSRRLVALDTVDS